MILAASAEAWDAPRRRTVRLAGGTEDRTGSFRGASAGALPDRASPSPGRAPPPERATEEEASLHAWAESPASDLDPTASELQISARILLYVSGQPRVLPGDTAPEGLTQAGMARALGTTQPAISNVVRRLVAGGALDEERAHVPKRFSRIKIYRLTRHGEWLVERIRQSLSRRAT